MTVKSVTLRIPQDKAAELEAVARVDEKSINQTMLEAIDHLIAERRKDEAFQARIREAIERERAVFERLAR